MLWKYSSRLLSALGPEMIFVAPFWMIIASSMNAPWSYDEQQQSRPYNRFEEDRFAGFGAPGLSEYMDDRMMNDYPPYHPNHRRSTRKLPDLTHTISSCHVVAIAPKPRPDKTSPPQVVFPQAKRTKRFDDYDDDDWEDLKKKVEKQKKKTRKSKKDKGRKTKVKKGKKIVIPSRTTSSPQTFAGFVAPLPQLATSPSPPPPSSSSVYSTSSSAEDRKVRRRLEECQDELNELKEKAVQQRKKKSAVSIPDDDDYGDDDDDRMSSKRKRGSKRARKRPSKKPRRKIDRDDGDDYEDEDEQSVERKKPKKKKRFGKLGSLLSSIKGKKKSKKELDESDDEDLDGDDLPDKDRKRRKSKRSKKLGFAAAATAGTAAVAIPAIIAALQKAQKNKKSKGGQGDKEKGGGIGGKVGDLIGKLFGKKKPAEPESVEKTADPIAAAPTDPDDREVHVDAPMMDAYNQQQKAALQTEAIARQDLAKQANPEPTLAPQVADEKNPQQPASQSTPSKTIKRLTKEGSDIDVVLTNKTPNIDVKVLDVKNAD